MAQKSGNNVTPPVHEEKNIASDTNIPTTRDNLNAQHSGPEEKTPRDTSEIGQSTGTGRPALTKK